MSFKNFALFDFIQILSLKVASESGAFVNLTSSKQQRSVSGITSRECYT